MAEGVGWLGGMAAMTFACGCTLAAKLAYGYTPRREHGEQVCPEHGSPAKGARSFERFVELRNAILRDGAGRCAT